MKELYLILTWGTFWVMMLIAVLFILIDIPKDEKLKNYKHARFLLSCVYLFVATINFMEIIGGKDYSLWYLRIITLWIGSSMSPSLSIINITLLDSSYFSFKRFFKELILPFLFTVLTFVLFLRFSVDSVVFLAMYYLFVTYYLFLMLKFTLLLIKEFKKFEVRFDNYFSDSEANHLSWVLKTQIIAIVCGVVAFVSFFLPLWFVCPFSAFLICFYSYYAVRFINYPSKFSQIEPLLIEHVTENINNSISFNQLETAISEWENKKMFLRSDVNIELVAKELYTNRTYLSSYINTYKNKSFKLWISDLRISEAQRILLSEPQVPISDIAYRVGFSDKSNFTNRFLKNVGKSPRKWREFHLSQN